MNGAANEKRARRIRLDFIINPLNHLRPLLVEGVDAEFRGVSVKAFILIGFVTPLPSM
jgi:hypothetical protein